MVVLENLIADITLLYTDKDVYDMGRDKSAAQYLERHGWKEISMTCAKTIHRGVEFKGSLHFQKTFQNFADMQNELKDIELAFHDRKTIIPSNDVYTRTWGSINN